MANHLAFFQMDLTDPDLRKLTLAVLEANQRAVTALLQDALDADELHGLEPGQLAPVLLTVAQGAPLSWAVYRKGSARTWARRHIDTALRPYRRGPLRPDAGGKR